MNPRDPRERRKGERRHVERREPQRAVNVRHDDPDVPLHGRPKRIRYGAKPRAQ